MNPNNGKAKSWTVGALLGIVGVMLLLTAVSVPLYRLFCSATGAYGTTQRAEIAPDTIVRDRTVTIRFNASLAPGLEWQFRPDQASVKVHPGETKIVTYRAYNFSKVAMTGTATFNVTPAKAGLYFDKLQCFCFSEQRLEPGQSAELAVQFFVDPDMVNDHSVDDVDTITLSYTMFRAKEEPIQSSALPSSITVN
jgi:cytochrome c oxidase assembly protein subunit 11